jgi:hypothetical protein
MYSESGLVPSSSLFQNHVLTVVMSFEVYVSDVIGRRFEKVKNGHIFENWKPTWGLDVDLSLTYILYFFLSMYDQKNMLHKWLIDFWCLTPLSAISWRPVLVVEEAGLPGENHKWQKDTTSLKHLYTGNSFF